jgi:hypothetical protein
MLQARLRLPEGAALRITYPPDDAPSPSRIRHRLISGGVAMAPSKCSRWTGAGRIFALFCSNLIRTSKSQPAKPVLPTKAYDRRATGASF